MGGSTHIVGAGTELLDDLAVAIAKDNLFRVKDWVHKISAHGGVGCHPVDPFFNVTRRRTLQRAEQIARTG
jgi:hypothetical protein